MKQLLLSLILLLGGVTLTAQAPQAEEKQQSLLWEISGNGLNTSSFLYGTIHMINKEDFFLTEATESAFEKSSRVTFEIDMEEMTDFSALMPLIMSANMKGDTTLSDLLSEEDYALVREHFSDFGPMFSFLERIKPMFLSAMDPEEMMSGGGMSSGGMVSYEMELMGMAQSQSKEIDGLETAAYQMSMFDSIPYKEQADMLVETIKGSSSNTDQFSEMIELYKAQDVEAMYQYIQESGGMEGFDDLLLVQRNLNWIPIMETMMAEEATFFAVGAGHLGGPQGVINLLRKAGYTVSPR